MGEQVVSSMCVTQQTFPASLATMFFIKQSQFDEAWTLLLLDEYRSPIENIQHKVCKYFGMSKNDLLSKRRDVGTATRRFIAIYLCKELTDKSLPQIGKAFKRDHTSVLHAIRRAEELIASNEFVACAVDEIRNQIRGC